MIRYSLWPFLAIGSGLCQKVLKIHSSVESSFWIYHLVLTSHSDDFRSVVISISLKCIVSSSDDETIRVSSLATGELTRVLQDHISSVLSWPFRRETSILPLEMWTADPIRVLRGHGSIVGQLLFQVTSSPKFLNENYWTFIVKRRIGRQFGIEGNGESQVVDLMKRWVMWQVGT